MVERTPGRPVSWALMPLVSCDEDLAIKRQGMQSLLVFSDGDVSMGLAVAEIVDIVEDKLDIELLAERSDLVGSAVVRGTHDRDRQRGALLADGSRNLVSQGSARRSQEKSLLLVDSSTFFRDMLVPVLRASGYGFRRLSTAQEAVRLLSGGLNVDVS